MSRSIGSLCLNLLAFILILSPVMASGAKPSGPASWQAKMAEINQLLSELAPFIYDETAFNDPKNREKIAGLTNKLASGAHTIDQMKKKGASASAPDEDPALKFLSRDFDDAITRANQSFSEGHLAYSRSLLRTTVSYCISCHTRTSTHSTQPLIDMNNLFANAGSAERIKYYAATRQFERVSEEFKKTSEAKTEANDYEAAARVALSVAIRVQKDLDRAIQIAKLISENKNTSEATKADAKVWLKELDLWKKDAAGEPKDANSLLAAARELVIRGQILREEPGDSRGDIAFLKGSSYLHELLKKKPNKAQTADALYYIGVCYEALRDLGFWSLHEGYYEACINEAPGTTRAVACYERLSDSIVAGYTGTRGTDLPAEVQRHLNSLKKKAAPQGAKKSGKS